MARSRRQQSGQAIVLVAVMIAVLLGFLGLSVDSGRAYLDRRDLQNASDATVLTIADYFENQYTVAQSQQAAVTLFENDERIYGGIATSSGWCSTPTGYAYATCTTNLTFNNDVHTLSVGYQDYRYEGKGIVFIASSTDKLPLAFMQVLKAGTSVSIGATAQTVVFDQAQTPAILVTGTGCSPAASLTVTGGETVTVVGAIYSDGGTNLNGSSSVNVAGNVYATCPGTDQFSGINQGAGYSEYPGVGPLAVNYAGGSSSPYYGYYSANNRSWDTSGSSPVEVQPGVYGNDPKLSSSECYFLDPGIYEYDSGFTDTGGLISNELKPPDEPVYNNVTQRAGTSNGYVQFWRNGVTCDGSFNAQVVSVGTSVTVGTWSFVVTSAREDPFNPTYPSGSTVYYPRGSAPSMCRAVHVTGSNQGIQLAISNVPGAQWYNVYANFTSGNVTCPTTYSSYGYVGSVCSGQASVAGCSGILTMKNGGTCPNLPSLPATPGPSASGPCNLGYTVSPVYGDAALDTLAPTGTPCTTVPSPSVPDYPGSTGISTGCAPPDGELCPSIVSGSGTVTCAVPGSTSPMPPNEVPGRNSPTTGDREGENECADNGGYITTCPGTITPGAVQFYLPNNGSDCFDDEGTGGAWVFSGRQYDYIVIYSLVDTSTCKGTNANKIAGGAATSWIGTTYFPNAYLTITGSSKAPVSGQVIAYNLNIDGSAGVTVDYNPNLAPTPPGGRLIV